jgi:hypothetical protein
VRLSEIDVLLHTGERLPLARLYETPVALVFLRHFG